jgi:hypothetical protein
VVREGGERAEGAGGVYTGCGGGLEENRWLGDVTVGVYTVEGAS